MSTDQVEPHLFIVLGATGDLMRGKLLPALYHLNTKGVLAKRCLVLGVSRKKDLDDEGFRAWARFSTIRCDEATDRTGKDCWLLNLANP